jgi:hypothetical protein
MAKTETAATRAPRGTKVLAKAFFTAAENIPEAQRDAVFKAALSLIREEWKTAKAKTRTARAVQKTKAVKAPNEVVAPKASKSAPVVVEVPKPVAKKASKAMKKIAAAKPVETQQAAE